MNKFIIDGDSINIHVYLKTRLVCVGIVDKDDYDIISSHTWYLNNNGYLITRVNRHKQILLHRMILGESTTLDVDHINMNKLDNRRINLRWTTRSQNMMNNKAIGVSFDKSRSKFAPHIMVNYKKIYLGRFNTIEEALIARQLAKNKYFGEYGNA